MKKNKKDNSPENINAIKKKPVKSGKKIEQGGENPNFPQEYEEQRSMNIRMKPQPFVKNTRSGKNSTSEK